VVWCGVHSLVGQQSAVAVQDLLTDAWSSYWTVTSRRSLHTALIYVIMTSLLTACPAVCVYYSVTCTRLINSLHQYTHELDNDTKVCLNFYVHFMMLWFFLMFAVK